MYIQESGSYKDAVSIYIFGAVLYEVVTHGDVGHPGFRTVSAYMRYLLVLKVMRHYLHY
ncbi:hypothetical protein C8Q78DRAFT_1032002 [Trametes maxima]|nr:hypothetical protein C8Q78DRAFT_1032002 [Trametes maxima]